LPFKTVHAIEKAFGILGLLAEQKRPMGTSEISDALGLHKGTVFNILHTLVALGVLQKQEGKFLFGARLYLLGRAAEQETNLISLIHPYLVKISEQTHLSAFLGMRAGSKAVILDKSESTLDLRISVPIGSRIPLLAGAHGKAFLAQLPDSRIRDIISREELQAFTRHSCVSKEAYLEQIEEVRREGVALDHQEYMEGVRALAVPLNINRNDLELAIWAVGLNGQIKEETAGGFARLLKSIAKEIENAFDPERRT
jgi:DNA-binding IclR family transcriptional regulator